MLPGVVAVSEAELIFSWLHRSGIKLPGKLRASPELADNEVSVASFVDRFDINDVVAWQDNEVGWT